MSVMIQQVHEVVADVPPEEVVPDGALEGVSSVQEQGVRFCLLRLLYGRVETGEAPDASLYFWLTYSAWWTYLVEAKETQIFSYLNFNSLWSLFASYVICLAIVTYPILYVFLTNT